MKLTLMPLQDGQVLRIRCQGMVSLRGAGTEEPLGQLLGPPCFSRTLLLDLVDAQGIDTSGVVWLARIAEKFRQNQGKLVVHSVPAVVRRMLDVLHLTSGFRMAHDEAEALQLVQQGSLLSN
jgi:ABC-type transporter Mla MlaB component